MVVTTADGVWVGSSRKAPRKRAVPSWTANPTRLWAPRIRADQLAIGGVEVEVPGELLLVGVAGVAAVARPLLVGQEAARHGVRNSGLSHAGRAWTEDQATYIAAKVLCGTGTFMR